MSSALVRRTPLARSAPLRARRKPAAVSEPGRKEWKRARAGWCDVCGHFSLVLHGHHVLYEQIVRREGGDPWAAENRMDVCSLCHMNHHSGARKIALSKVPARAVAFAVALVGEYRAADFFSRRYGAEERSWRLGV